MICYKCVFYGGYVKSITSYSGLKMICNASKKHIDENWWVRSNGAILPGRHCGVSK